MKLNYMYYIIKKYLPEISVNALIRTAHVIIVIPITLSVIQMYYCPLQQFELDRY